MQPKPVPSSTYIQTALTPSPASDPPLKVPGDVAASMKKSGYNPASFEKELSDLQASGKGDEALRTYGLIVDRNRRNSNAFGAVGRSPLTNLKDGGRGISITTQLISARMMNSQTPVRCGFVDEAQNLMQGAQADTTAALSALRAVTLHPDSAQSRTNMQNRDLVNRLASVSDQIRRNEKRMGSDDLMEYAGNDKIGGDTFILKKQVNGYYVLYKAVLTGKNALAFQTLYKVNRGEFMPGGPTPTSEATSPTANTVDDARKVSNNDV